MGSYLSFVLGPVPDDSSSIEQQVYLKECHSVLSEDLIDCAENGHLVEVRKLAERLKPILEQRRVSYLAEARIEKGQREGYTQHIFGALGCPNPNCSDGKEATVFIKDSLGEPGRGWIACAGCEMRGPFGTDLTETIDLWNGLLRVAENG